jgi:ABC-type branched-subunit amino acid transport system substrate-binding protein
LDYQGMSGRVQFDSTGFRTTQHSEVWNSLEDGSLSLSMTYNGSSISILSSPLFPGATNEIPDDQMDFIPISTIWSITSSVIPEIARPWTKNLVRYAAYWINAQPHYLPAKTKILIQINDDLGEPGLAVKYSMAAARIGAATVIGSLSSTMCQVVQNVVSAWGIPQVSTGTTSSALSNKALYPTFMRLVPSSDGEGTTIIAMAKSGTGRNLP